MEKALDCLARSSEATVPACSQIVVQSLGAPPVPQEVPSIPGLAVATGALLINGDRATASPAGCFSDVFALHDSFALVCGDIYGRGQEVASLARAAKNLLRQEAFRNSSPELAALRVSRMLASSTGEPCPLELLYARFQPAPRRLTLCNFGGWPPLMFDRDGARLLESRGSRSARCGSHECVQSEMTLAPGDIFAAYTNGIPEARQDKDRIFGIDSVRRLLEQHSHDSAQAIVTRILTLVSGYARPPFADDAVVLVARATE
ncbi:MAG: PP2C family protein-serine/threonine phosphatase [Actinomycetota bacterium]